MKGTGIGFGGVVLALCCMLGGVALGASEVPSMRVLMERSDLVAAGTLKRAGAARSFEMYALSGVEVLHGRPAGDEFRVVRFTRFGCQPRFVPGTKVLLFLHRLDPVFDAEAGGRPVYTVFAGAGGVYGLDGEEGEAVLGAARRYHGILSMEDGSARAAALAAFFSDALEEGCPTVLAGLLFDVVAVPGVSARIDPADGGKALARFQAAPPASELRRRLLLFLGEVRPAGLAPVLEAVVRSPEGRCYLPSLSAILARTDDPGTPKRLVEGFPRLDPGVRENVIRVLGGLGRGRGVPALRSIYSTCTPGERTTVIHALWCDRSDEAVRLLGTLAEAWEGAAALEALQALGGINTAAARSVLREIARDPEGAAAVASAAAKILEGLGP